MLLIVYLFLFNRAYKQALGVLRTSYQGIEEDDQNGTDFAELLGQYEAQQQGTTRGEYDVRSHSDFKELDSRIAVRSNIDLIEWPLFFSPEFVLFSRALIKSWMKLHSSKIFSVLVIISIVLSLELEESRLCCT